MTDTASACSAEPSWARHLPPCLRAADVDLTEERSLPAAWSSRWAADLDARVLRDPAEGWVTAGELEERTRRVAGRLHGAGLQAGDRILLSATTSLDLVVAHVAALRLGLVVVPVNATYREPEVAHIVRDAEPSGAVVDDAGRAGWVRAASPGAVTVVGPDVDLRDAPAPELDRSAGDDLALISYTSGTTGSPKGAMLTHANLLAGSVSVGLAWRWTVEDRLVLSLPLFHMHGLGVGLHGTLLAGASAVLLPSFDVDTVLDAVSGDNATLFFGVPTMYARLARSPRLGELAPLRLCVSGSAPLPPDLHARVAERARQRILERYGMTETLMNVSNPYDGARVPGTVGFPLPGVELRLEPADTSRRANPGGIEADAGDNVSGEILVRGPNVFPGYWHRPQATADAFDPDGWFRTGDVGAVDADGYLAIVGRTKELIITGGYNVYPREVEDVVRAHPHVADVAVVGTASEEWGETVTAVVVANGPQEPDALLAFAAERLAPYKRPRLVRYVDELPRNALGKVLRHEL